MNNEKVVINREKKGRKKKSIEGYIAKEQYNKLDNQVYKEIHIFRPPSRQGAQVVGFQGERAVCPLLPHCSQPVVLRGATESWSPQITARAGRRQDRQRKGGAGMGSVEMEADSPAGGESESKPHVQAFSGDHPFFSSSISLLSCCWLRLQTVQGRNTFACGCAIPGDTTLGWSLQAVYKYNHCHKNQIREGSNIHIQPLSLVTSRTQLTDPRKFPPLAVFSPILAVEVHSSLFSCDGKPISLCI